MIKPSDFERLLRPVKNKIFLLIGRGILKAVNNTESTQKVQVTLLKGEQATDLERFQEYGLETYPLTDSETLGLFLNGLRSHGIIIKVHDRRNRPQNLTEGDSMVYTSANSVSGSEHRIWLKKADNEIQKDCNTETTNARTKRVIKTPGTTHTGDYTVDGDMVVTGNLTVNGNIVCDGNITAGGNVTDATRSMAADRAIYNSHVHTNPEGGNVGPAAPQQ